MNDKSLKNLKPFDSDSARKAGQKSSKAGSKHLKTLIQDIGNNIDWDKTTLKDKSQMKEMYGNNAWKALTYVAFTKAMAGDPKAMDWLAKNGYGQSIDVTSDGQAIKTATIIDLGNVTNITETEPDSSDNQGTQD
jgi:hypothetical protein